MARHLEPARIHTVIPGPGIHRGARYGCRVDGGTQTHGINGFWCAKCAESNPGLRMTRALTAIDRHSKGD